MSFKVMKFTLPQIKAMFSKQVLSVMKMTSRPVTTLFAYFSIDLALRRGRNVLFTEAA